MSELLYASFDNQADANLAGEWAIAGAGLTVVAARTSNGLRGTAAASRAANTLRSHPVTPILDDGGGFHGIAVAYSSLPLVDADLCAVLDAGGAVLLTFTVTPTGTVKVYRGTSTSGTLIATTTNVVFAGDSVFRYFEIGWTFGATLGTVQIRLTEPGSFAVADAFFNVNTGTFGAARFGAMEWYLLDGIVTIDDLYVKDAYAGGTFKGDSVILSALVSAQDHSSNHDFLATNWVPSTGSDKAAVVDDAAPNGDTDYLAASMGALIYYDMVSLVDSRPVTGVQLVATARKVNSASTASLLVHGGSVTPALTTAWQAVRRMISGVYNTIADVNAELFTLGHY